MRYQNCSYKVLPLRTERFHVRLGEMDDWKSAFPKHSELTVGSVLPFNDLVNQDALSIDEFLLLASKGGFEDIHDSPVYTLADYDATDALIEQAVRKGRLRHKNWKLRWGAEGYHDETSDVISRVLGDESGRLSDTTRLLLGPDSCVVEIYFPDGDELPIIEGVYDASAG